ncbi:uncharacterized protein [Montipora foliosa]|uniref:uncharacterized protein n=1 Tax=Montipora foliosa TaxID=591990 RepID=UPI0035F12B36
MNYSSMTKPIGIMPNHLDLREITFTNLLLLDFNPVKMESKYRVVFNRDMFVLPNKKAMEVVMHFLFSRLHPQLAYEEFRDCWPIRDKFLEQQFRKVCFNWVSRIQKEDPEARFPRIVQSLFHSPGGDRFYTFLHHFSLYVLAKVMQRDHGKVIIIPTFPTKTVHNHSFTHVMSRALEAHYIVLKQRFLQFTQHAVQVENQWKEYAMESTKEYRALVKRKRDLERQVMELNGLTAPRGSNVGIKTDYQEEVEALKRTQQLQQVRDLWSGLTEFYSMQGPQRRIIDSVLQDEANKYKVDAADIQPRVPDLLLRDCEEEIRKRNIQDTYIGGKVNLYSLLQLWNLSLSKIKDQICQDPLPSFHDQSAPVKSAIHTHHAHLTNTIALREAIERTMPAMKETVNKMKSHSYKTVQQQRSRLAEVPILFKLGLVPPSPPVSFAAADTPAAERLSSFNKSLKMSPDAVSTPDVIQGWTKSARIKKLHDQEETSANHAKPVHKMLEPSRLPRPKPQVAKQSRDSALIASKSTQKKNKKKPPAQRHAEESIPYPHYVSPRTQGGRNEPLKVLKPQALLAEQIADAVAKEDSTSSSLSSSNASSRASTPKPQALVDPVGALGQDAFQSRDLIPRTPSKARYDLTQARTEQKPGRLLETILDESTVTTTPSSVQEKPPTERSPQANLSWSDIICRPRLPSTSQNKELLSAQDPPSVPVDAVGSHFDIHNIPDGQYRNSVSFHHLSNGTTPGTVKKYLFEGSFEQGDSLRQQPQTISSHMFPPRTPKAASVPLVTGSSPQLDFWLLPQSSNLNLSGHKDTPTSVGIERHDATSLNGNSPFSGLRFHGGISAQFTGQGEKPTPEGRAGDVEPVHLESGSTLYPTGIPCANPNTRESAERLNAIQQPWIQRDRWGLHQNSSANRSATKNSLNPVDPALTGGSPLLHLHVTDATDVTASGKNPFASSTEASYGEGLHVLDGTSSGLPETFLTPATHPTPSHSLVSKQSAFENASSSSYDVDTSALIERLNKIKLRQQSISSPHDKLSRSFEASEAATASDTSLLASRLDQIKQARNSQQVTPGANVDGELNTSRASEPALLTPLTPSSRNTPSEDGSKNESVTFSFSSPPEVTSLPESPSSPLERNFFLQSPFKDGEVYTASLQKTPPSPLIDTNVNLKLVEGLKWEETTPNLPQRLVPKTGPTSGEKSSTVRSINGGFRSPVLDITPSSPPKQAYWSSGSNYSPVIIGGVGEQVEQGGLPLVDLTSPYSYGGYSPSDPRSLRQDVLQPPPVGQLINLE